MTTHVTSISTGDATIAIAHFSKLLSLETDCWDVHESIVDGQQDFVLVQCNKTAESFAAEHIAGAVHIPYATMTAESMVGYPMDTVFVVYCAGPHCNAADKAALRFAQLGRPVKKMIGGAIGWIDEGYSFVASET